MIPLYLLSIIYFTRIANALIRGEFTEFVSNQECPRIRKSWLDSSTTERELYISGLVKLREESNYHPDIDKFIAISEAHSSYYASFTHSGSNYFFWHGYLAYEMETQIRALGGEYACFGLPYWDFTKELEQDRIDDPMLFHTGIGGNGDPDNCWNVNGYTWEVSREQFWIPMHCCADGDVLPVCSFKRSWATAGITLPTAKGIGAAMRDKSKFIDFNKWYQGLDDPTMMQHGALYEDLPVDVSYDPLWFLYHSFVEYHRFMWIDCHEYDQIEPSLLDEHPEAYTAYCDDDDCDVVSNTYKDMFLDTPMMFADALKEKEWSYVYDHDLTIREFYDMTQLNVVFDLNEDDDAFYVNSGMKDYCKDRLNETWWITETDEIEQRSLFFVGFSQYMSSDYVYWRVAVLIVFVSFVVITMYSFYRANSRKSVLLSDCEQYGTF